MAREYSGFYLISNPNSFAVALHGLFRDSPLKLLCPERWLTFPPGERPGDSILLLLGQRTKKSITT